MNARQQGASDLVHAPEFMIAAMDVAIERRTESARTKETLMKRVLAVSMAFLMLGSSVAFARGDHGDRDHRVASYSYHHDNNAGAAVAAGIIGLGLGMIAASQAPAYYAPPYAAPVAPYGYAPAYGYSVPYGYAAPGINIGLHF